MCKCIFLTNNIIILNYNKIQIEIEYMLNDTQAINFLAQLNAFIAENQPSTVMVTRWENDRYPMISLVWA